MQKSSHTPVRSQHRRKCVISLNRPPPLMSVKIGEFHDRGSVLTMDIPSTDTPFVRQHLRNGDTVFINNQFANYYKTPLALAMVLSHCFPTPDAASKTADQRLDEIVAGFLDSMMTSAKLHEKELQRNESLLQNGSPARRLTIRSSKRTGNHHRRPVSFLQRRHMEHPADVRHQ